MKLHEYKAKEIFAKYGITVPEGWIASNTDEFVERLSAKTPNQPPVLTEPVAIKSQVLVGGRGKAGGIKFAANLEEAKEAIDNLIGTSIKGVTVRQVLIERKLEFTDAQELYVGFTIDRSSKRPVAIVSSEGGVDIEQVAATNPDKIFKLELDPLSEFQMYQARNLALELGLKEKQMIQVAVIIFKLYKLFREYDAELAEINPLILSPTEGAIAADAKLNIDDNSLYRHKEFSELLKETDEYTAIEQRAKDAGLAYVELDGDIGIIGCGAGLVMASLDILNQYNGKAANFLDVGGGATAENMRQALELVEMKSGVKSVFVNIFGGITRCDEIAKGIVDFAPKIPLSIRMMGTNQEE
ncbi:MAG: ADP-forming succinate--CoA ligase subunit beta, partial [Thermoplasmata archaeon]|nr:ADP-forming succinate--CoA ligase subunit beta [Thermoplasmata archaeon]